MARYTGPKTRISRIFGEPILGNGKWLTKNSNPPGQHGGTKKRKAPGEYALQLKEKQKANASSVNGQVVNVPSFELRPGDTIGLKESTQGNTGITSQIRGKNAKINWLDWSEAEFKGTFIALPERESVPENIKEQLIVELYSK
ncbi:hypothetical protein GP486_009003 [Trichoglossum hirsutum]|uniref:Small ribosomal subunit protein uS4 N-terminal domain-containing protein n=1 Tax=Trichoglossum hirsutum TaxID=265104 RepID=A0A9P8HTK2_9PEZI|nr:hypothetical protein GP486_009003 [Trichoglossum hirsutum]